MNIFDVYKLKYADSLKDLIPQGIRLIRITETSVENWMKYNEITDQEIEMFPNAKRASELKESKLCQILK